MASDRTESGAAPDTAPTESLVSSAVGDGCVNCGSPLAADQRYCVVCGERRGAARFSLPPAAAPAEAAPASRAGSRGGGGPSRLARNSGLTLVAGVATLLLAMLVGVLIGHNTANTKTVASAGPSVKVVTIAGGSAAPAATGTSTSGSSSSSVKPKTTAKKPTKVAAKKTAAAQSSAASKVLGGKSTPPPTVTVGSKGTGKGFSKKTHKFTGTFFGQ